MNESELAEYCRKKGIFPEQVIHWGQACENANDWDRQVANKLKAGQKENQKRIKQLEKELKRKKKSHAEAAALLVLQKKSRRSGGTQRRMISDPDRRKTVMLINEAREAGARLEPACRVVGICFRTYQRWTCEHEIKEDGLGIQFLSDSP